MEIVSSNETTITERMCNMEYVDAFVDFVLGGNDGSEIIGFIATMIRGPSPVSFREEVRRGATSQIGMVTHSDDFDYVAVSRSGDFSKCAVEQAFSVYWDNDNNTLHVIV